MKHQVGILGRLLNFFQRNRVWSSLMFVLLFANLAHADGWSITQLPIQNPQWVSINNTGEIVWTDSSGGGVFSSQRGRLATFGYYPHLANSGEVVYMGLFGSQWDLVSTTRGRLTSIGLNPDS